MFVSLSKHISRITLPLIAAFAAASVSAQTTDVLKEQMAAYNAVRAKSVIELQPFRHTVSGPLFDGERAVRLISLNPEVNTWFLVQLTSVDGAKVLDSFHVENPDPAGLQINLDITKRPALVLRDADGTTLRCAPWLGAKSALLVARKTGLPFAPFCENRLYLRNQVTGSRSNLEATAEFLRDNVWGGESLVNFVKGAFFEDSEMKTSALLESTGRGRLDLGPGAALMDEPLAKRPVISTYNALEMDGATSRRMTMGLWYPITGLEGVFTSAIQPRSIADEVLTSAGPANRLDSVEGRANASFVAFDLGRYEIGYAVGTDHPRLGWSPRPPRSVRAAGMPGPDGIKTAVPLVRLGMVPPSVADRTIGVFTAGFKRSHGAFKWGDYITLNFGTHYGFIENGVILSKLQPHLSTLYVLTDGTIAMKTWEESDNALLPRIRFARQNGVPIIERDPETGQGVIGPLVAKWGPGNWSGSAEAKLRTLRAGACMRTNGDSKFLIYGYFSTGTPSAMARTFQAYGCDYAMLLDMNALEHTHLALFVRAKDGSINVEHLMPGMALIEKRGANGTIIPRFLGFADNRDLFYMIQREDIQ